MAVRSKNTTIVAFIVHIFKIVLFLAGGFLLFRNKEKITSFIKNRNFLVSAAYVIVIGFMALLYRLIIVVNWIIQQGR